MDSDGSGEPARQFMAGAESVSRRKFPILWLLIGVLLLCGHSDLVNRASALLPNLGGLLFDDEDDAWQDDEEGDPCDPPSANDGPEGDGAPCGMPQWRISEPFVNVWIQDVPLRWRMSNGRWFDFKLSYKQRASTNDWRIAGFGTNWECNWIGYLSVGDSGLGITNHRAGGGIKRFALRVGVQTENGTGRAVFWSGGGSSAAPGLHSPSGARNDYRFPLSFAPGVTNFLFSDRLDQYGRSTRYEWSSNYISGRPLARLDRVYDRDGKFCTLAYTNATFPHLITSITDPYSRTARFLYDHRARLTNIIDMAGMPSYFTYDDTGLITTMNTRYGDTSFRSFQSGLPGGIDRAVEVTEANGQRQLYAYSDEGSRDGDWAAANFAWPDGEKVYRNSFHWDRKQFETIPVADRANYLAMPLTNYYRASLKHWLKRESDSYAWSDWLGAMAGPVLDPEQSLERSGQVFFQYQGQTDPGIIGTLRRVTNVVWKGTSYAPGTSPAIAIGRNTWGRPTSITYRLDGAPATYNQYYDADGRVLQRVTGPRGELVRGYGYHPVITNLLTSVTNALLEVIRYTHDTNGYKHKVLTITHPSGLVTSNSYYSSGTYSNFLQSRADMGIRTNSFTYLNGNVSAHTDELGLTVSQSWDNLNRLLTVTYPDTTTEENVYDKLDLVGVKDRMNGWTRYLYDKVRQLKAATNANGAVTQYDYCGCGSPSDITNWNGSAALVTRLSYDLAGRLVTALYPDSYYLSYTYDALDRVSRVVDGGGRQVELGYNDYSQVSMVKAGPTGGQKTWAARTFDEYGRLTHSIDHNGVTVTNLYDSLDRLRERGIVGGGKEKFFYNPRGLTNHVDELGTNTWFVYDAASRLLFQTNGNNETLQFSYNPAGQLTQLIDGKGQPTTWKYDPYGRLTNKVDAAGADTFRYGYDANGRLTSRWQAGGITTVFRYDPVGNLTNIDYPGTVMDITNYYDSLNRLTNMIDSCGASAFTWTDGNQLQSEGGRWPSDKVTFTYQNRLRSNLALQQPSGVDWTQSYGYDEFGRLTNTASPASLAGSFGTQYKAVITSAGSMLSDLVSVLKLAGAGGVANSFDDLGRLRGTVLTNGAGVTLNSHAYTYNAAHQRTRQTLKDNNFWEYTYDGIGQLRTARGTNNTQGTLTPRLHEQFGYAYDGAWNLSWRTNNDLRVQFQANNLNQLTTASRSGTLTVAGNVTQGSAPYTVSVTGPGLSSASGEVYPDSSWARTNATPVNGQSTYTVTATDSQARTGAGNITVNLPNTVSFTYDSRGNLTGDGQRVFEYDYENQLTNLYVAGAWRSEFKYDGLGRRRIRKEYSWSGSDWGSPTNQVRYIFDGMVVIQERNETNGVQVTYTRGNDLSGSKQGAGGIGGLLARTASGAHAYYHADGNGNITCLADTNVTVVARYSYDPFGNLLWSSGTLARLNLYRFSSKEAHANSGLYYYGFRFYEPNLQRWVNRDPLGEWAGANLFQFVRNDSNNRVDLNGLCEPKPGDAPLILNLLAFVLGRGTLAGKVGVPARIGQGEALAAGPRLSAAQQVGWVNPIPKYPVNAPWYRYTTPSFAIDAGVVTEGRTAAQIAATKLHEGQHIMDVIAHPQVTHLATQKGFFPGSGFARYWLEYRGYSAGGQLQGLGTPFQSFNMLQKANFGMDALIFGGGTAGAVYVNSCD